MLPRQEAFISGQPRGARLPATLHSPVMALRRVPGASREQALGPSRREGRCLLPGEQLFVISAERGCWPPTCTAGRICSLAATPGTRRLGCGPLRGSRGSEAGPTLPGRQGSRGGRLAGPSSPPLLLSPSLLRPRLPRGPARSLRGQQDGNPGFRASGLRALTGFTGSSQREARAPQDIIISPSARLPPSL